MVIVLQKLVVDIVWFVRLKFKKNPLKTKKKQEIKRSFVDKKILIIYLKCNAVKELGKKKKKSLRFGVKTHHEKT